MFCPINITKNDFVSFHAIKAKPFQQKKTNRKKRKKHQSGIFVSLRTCRNNKKIPKTPVIPRTSTVPKY